MQSFLSTTYSAILTFILAFATSIHAAPQSAGNRAGVAIPISERFSVTNADGSVNFDILKSHAAAVDANIFENHKHITGKEHPLSASRVKKRGSSTGLMYGRGIWYGTVYVGSPPLPFTGKFSLALSFDTGACDFILPSFTCIDPGCEGHTLWNPSLSETSYNLTEPFNIKYGNRGLVSGYLFFDTVYLAGLPVRFQRIGVAESYSPEFRSHLFLPDGIMGMGFQSLSAYRAPSVFENLVAGAHLSKPVFSFMLSRWGGELYVGGTNSALFEGDFTFVPVTDPGYWEVNMDSISINGLTYYGNIPAVIDTGSSVIFGPSSLIQIMYDDLGGKQLLNNAGLQIYTLPCDNFAIISLTFGGKTFPIHPSTLNLGTVQSQPSRCVSGIFGGDGHPFFTIGNIFLQGVYTTFDLENFQVGFAQLA